jgi:ATP-dependent DNA ligase
MDLVFRTRKLYTSPGIRHLRSRDDEGFNRRYPAIMKVIASTPDDTVIDGEIVVLDESGRPSFNALQNYGSSATPVQSGRAVM